MPGKINRHKFALESRKSHASKSLQADWNELGDGHFEFETIEDVVPRDDPNYDYKADLEFLEDLWLEKLEPTATKVTTSERKRAKNVCG